MKKIFQSIVILLVVFIQISQAQETGTIYGTIADTASYSVGFANISVPGSKYGTTADRFGQFELTLPSGEKQVAITCIGYKTALFPVNVIAGKRTRFDFVLSSTTENLEEVKVVSRTEQSGTLQRIDAKVLGAMPNVSGNIENIVKQLPGVASNNELSSQYSVRGGSFDENLVYVNDIEIYRPILIRSGQQEGLSFVNSDMVGSLKFSAGGFDATYGDKMSSILDISYKKPSSNAGSFTGSLLGGSISYEGLTNNGKLRYIAGVRYKTSQYLLSSMDTKGEYKPSFADVQANVEYDITPSLEISFLGNIGQNKYEFIPTNRTVEFGTFQIPLKAEIFYEGQENDAYRNMMGAMTLNFHKSDRLSLKLITAMYSNRESETFDLLGEYNISQVDKQGNQSDSSLRIGVGGFLNHARNFLDVDIATVSHVGSFSFEKNKLKWGVSVQNEKITDRLNEWEYVDSAGYEFPYTERQIVLSKASRSINDLTSQRFMGFIQHTLELSPGNDKLYISTGIRANYWTLNRQTIISPRFNISYMPSRIPNLLLYASVGAYHQPPFYKELRNPNGDINRNLKAQKSYNIVVGGDYFFYYASRPFKFTTEIYYKKLSQLVPYRIDNVRSIYAGENMAKGYARGIDFKINGEFIKGTESWLSLSLLQTEEDIAGDSYTKKITRNNVKIDTTIFPGYYSRPTDQFVNMSLYFQDYLPRYPSYKVHISIHYGSNLPVTFPLSNRWDDVNKYLPSYKRVDFGISKMLKGEETKSSFAVFNVFKEVWLSAEVFNIIGVSNTASFMWIKSVSNDDGTPGYFAVPNYLTGRRLNIKLVAKF